METLKKLFTQFLIVSGVALWIISAYGYFFAEPDQPVYDCSIAETADYPVDVVDACRRLRRSVSI